MMTVENRVGRLCEALFVPPFAVSEVVALTASIRKILGGMRRPAVFCCDARLVSVFPPDVSEQLTLMMRADNPKIERNGLLVGESSVFGLQIERMFRDAQNPGRRAFRASGELTVWLGETLEPAERERLGGFLGAHS